MAPKVSKTIIGREEWCAFPEMGIPAIKARIDTGARTSSMHAWNIHTFEQDSQPWVRFDAHPIDDVIITCEHPLVDQRSVKSSSGDAEVRYVITSTLTLGDSSWEIQLTLTNRDTMGFRMLLGREAMNGRIMVDPAKACTQGKLSENALNSLYGEN